MIAIPPGVRVWLACGRTDMRKGMDGLAMLAQQVLNSEPIRRCLVCLPRAARRAGEAVV